MRRVFGWDQGADQAVDPLLIELASLLAFWAIVGMATIVGWMGSDAAILVALAPIGFLLVEVVARAIAARIAR